MDKVTLGNTGLRVSIVGFGGIPITRLTDADAAWQPGRQGITGPLA